MSHFTDGKIRSREITGGGGAVTNHTLWESQCNVHPAAAPHADGISHSSLSIPKKVPVISGAFKRAQDG